MLRFFRRIRKKLLEKGAIKKYLAYAIGEIFLVVIGILIALQINSWNQAHQDRIIERNYLVNLIEDLKADTTWLNFYMINRFDRKVAALNKVKSFYQGTDEISDTLAFLAEAGYGAVFGNPGGFAINRNVYDELVSTGNLRKIRQETLRNQINTYYAYVKRVDDGARFYQSGYVNFINSLRPFSFADSNEIQVFDRQLMLKHLRTEEAYRLCNLELTLAHTFNSRAHTIQENALALMQAIEKEME